MLEADQDGVMMELAPSPGRRAFALAAVYGLGLLLVALGVLGGRGSVGGGVLWALGLIVLGGLSLWAGERMRRATRLSLRLTLDGLSDSSGRVLARWDEIERVDRGAFAAKPSSGFLLVLRRPAPGAWEPGLWWRIGRRVGVGGVLPMRPARFMAEQMALRLAAGLPPDRG